MKANLLEFFYILIGLISLIASLNIFFKKDVTHKIITSSFYFILSIIMIFGKQLPPTFIGILIIILGCISLSKRISLKPLVENSSEEKIRGEKQHKNFLFIPAFSIAIISAFVGYFFPSLGALVGLGIGSVIAVILAKLFVQVKFKDQLIGGSSLMVEMGAVLILPPLLASLGLIFTKAHVGDAIADIFGATLNKDNLFLSITIYYIAMAGFTIIMGNAFAAFAVITAGIGVPFVYPQVDNVAIISMLAMLSGYCGTLLTPMAANFNIVPTILLNTKSKYSVIKAQIPVAILILITNILVGYSLGV